MHCTVIAPLLLPLLVLLGSAPRAWSAEEVSSRQRLSWIAIEGPRQTQLEGDAFTVTVAYALHAGPPATLTLTGHGPWIDLPDGTYETKRRHIHYPGLQAEATVQAGTGRQTFHFTVPPLAGGNGVLWVAAFREADGTRWPWEIRATTRMRPAPAAVMLVAEAPNHLFTDEETVAFATSIPALAGTKSTARWSITDPAGAIVGRGEQALDMPIDGSPARLAIPCTRRGVFALSVAVDGAGAVSTTFARIPDVLAITAGAPTAFGLHHLLNPAEPAEYDRRMRAARRLGMTTCRQFIAWSALEPSRGQWRWDDLDLAIDKAAEHGIRPLLCLVHPPPWAMTRRLRVAFEPFAFDEAGWTDTVSTLARRYRGRVDAWEWLNEIVPGAESDPISIYLRMCELGTAAAKAADPQVRTALAGGLWPRSFRQGLLAAGVARHIDVLPIHYGSGAGVREAAGDLAAVGATAVEVWDNETARGVSTWGMPRAEAMQRREQRLWAMQRWPELLAAGARRVIWFGGSGDPAGNWDPFWGDGSPRPVAATLAVIAAKLHNAQPEGSFRLGAQGPFHLFTVEGRAVLVVPAGTGTVTLHLGNGPITLTDDQGSERHITAEAAGTALDLGDLPYFVEGGDLTALRGYTAPTLTGDAVSLLAGDGGRLQLDIANRGGSELAAEVSTTLPPDWPGAAAVRVWIAPGATQRIELPLAVPADATAGDHSLAVSVRYADPRLPEVELPWMLALIDPTRLGNRLEDGGFEADGSPWRMDSATTRVGTGEFTQGLGRHLLRMAGSTEWQHATQSVAVVPGRSYLYSAWIRVADKQAGSNIYPTGGKPLHLPYVFSAINVPEWQYVSTVYTPAAGVTETGFTPVARGAGTAWLDNVRLTVHDGTSFATEARQRMTPPVIDGDLAEWTTCEPIPLLGPGQTTVLDPAWKAGSANLRGVVKLSWDAQNCYLAAWIDDDHLAAPMTGEQAVESDSLILALHPGNRAPDADDRAFALYLSPAIPGGGSGTSTLYRPEARSGGLSTGHLAKDSSRCDLVIQRIGTLTCYEARIPWSELGIANGRLGLKLGCSFLLNDNDGMGRAAFIAWGDGLAPAWNPQRFGVLTLVGSAIAP